MHLCVNTQTPLIRFLETSSSLVEKYGDLPEKLDLSMLEEGSDYLYSPGGVTAMVYPLLKRLLSSGDIESATWVSLSPGAPTEFVWNGIRFLSIDLDRKDAEGYVRFKERLWNAIHSLEQFKFVSSEYLSFSIYSWRTADTLLRLSEDCDIYYIHDFQQLQVGNFVSPFAPAVFRWHIPVNFDGLGNHLRKFLVRNMEAYDAVIVSTKKDLESIIRSGFSGMAYQLYPHVDASVWRQPSQEEREEFLRRAGIGEGTKYFLVVARMDPVKSQDVAIKAMKRVVEKYSDYHLVLIGDGSFSGSSKGGLGSSKSTEWRRKLEKLSSELGISHRIHFLGYADERLLRAGYSGCTALVLPSRIEGFGLVTVEAWLMNRPAIVSDGAGSSELVIDGSNGYRFKAGDHEDLAEKMLALIESGNAEEMGKRGFDTARQCSLEAASARIKEIMQEARSLY
jgi:glycosyltransferase involved in cell wall biosynthesis